MRSISNLFTDYIKSHREELNNISHEENISIAWTYKIMDCPKQSNYSDCGVFICKYMDFICRNETFLFSRKEINYYRYLMGVELMQGELVNC